MIRRYQLMRLQRELAAAGIVVAGLRSENDTVIALDANGQVVPLPPAAATVIAAHDPTVRDLSAGQLAALVRWRAVRDAATFAAAKPALLWLLWFMLKALANLRDGEEETT